MRSENDAARRTIDEIWRGTPPRTAANNGPRAGRPTVTQVDSGPADADLPDSDDEDAEAADEDDIDGSGVLWDDKDFVTPSSIKVTVKTFTGIEWMRPPVSTPLLVYNKNYYNL